jgi:hypothetical protein
VGQKKNFSLYRGEKTHWSGHLSPKWGSILFSSKGRPGTVSQIEGSIGQNGSFGKLCFLKGFLRDKICGVNHH